MTDYEKARQDISNFIDWFAPTREANDQLQKELEYICNRIESSDISVLQ